MDAQAETEQKQEYYESLLAQAGENLKKIYPGQVFTRIGAGSSAAVYESDGKVYKVMIPLPNINSAQAYNVPYDRDEAAKLALLGPLGLSPKLVEYVEAEEGAVQLKKRPSVREFEELDHLVPKRTTPVPQPVVVMEKVNFDPDGMKKMSNSELLGEYYRIRDIALAQGISFADVEFVYDKDQKRVVLVDAGGVHKNASETNLVKDLIHHLSRDRHSATTEDVQGYLDSGNTAAIERLLTRDSRPAYKKLLGRLRLAPRY